MGRNARKTNKQSSQGVVSVVSVDPTSPVRVLALLLLFGMWDVEAWCRVVLQLHNIRMKFRQNQRTGLEFEM
jgi:hypothetical protein